MADDTTNVDSINTDGIQEAVPIEELEGLVKEMRLNLDGLEDIGTPASKAAKIERERWSNRIDEIIADHRP